MQTINTNTNKEALDAHGFSQKERIVQNISLALNVPDIQPIRAMNITKNRTNVHGAFDRRSEWCYVFVLLLSHVATFLPVAYIFIQGTLESKLDEIS